MEDGGSRLEEMIRAACVLEATARKAGNVHPLRSFPDLTYRDFVHSADAVAPILARSAERGVGSAILGSIEATRDRVGRNTNLGMILLLAPLAAVPLGVRLVDGISDVLQGLSHEDAELAYRAIRLAHPGGMGQVAREDISGPPTTTLLEAMRLAADRDLVARQYAENFSLVLEFGVAWLQKVADFKRHWEPAIVGLQLELLSRHADSLIARKCGLETAAEASRRAAVVLAAARPGTRDAQEALNEFDRWLRADGNRRNPGTTADLIAAILFAAFRDGGVPVVSPPPAPGW
jgi:triphosphoribosyl-dephospho-CoA synthase